MVRLGSNLASERTGGGRRANVHRFDGQFGGAFGAVHGPRISRRSSQESPTSHNRVKHNISTGSTIPVCLLSTFSANRELFRTVSLRNDSATGSARSPVPCTGPSPCRFVDGLHPFSHPYGKGRCSRLPFRQSLRSKRDVSKNTIQGPGCDVGSTNRLRPVGQHNGGGPQGLNRPSSHPLFHDCIPSAVLRWRATRGPGCSAYVAGQGGNSRNCSRPVSLDLLHHSTARMLDRPRRAWRKTQCRKSV